VDKPLGQSFAVGHTISLKANYYKINLVAGIHKLMVNCSYQLILLDYDIIMQGLQGSKAASVVHAIGW